MMGVDDYDDDDGCVLTMMMIYLGNGRWHVVGVWCIMDVYDDGDDVLFMVFHGWYTTGECYMIRWRWRLCVRCRWWCWSWCLWWWLIVSMMADGWYMCGWWIFHDDGRWLITLSQDSICSVMDEDVWSWLNMFRWMAFCLWCMLMYDVGWWWWTNLDHVAWWWMANDYDGWWWVVMVDGLIWLTMVDDYGRRCTTM